GRGLQGLGGGMLIAAAHTMVREVFPEALWSHMLATISLAWGIAALGGPALGGVLAGLGLWRMAFWAITPITVVAAALTWRILRTVVRHDAHATKVPLGRLALICVSVLSIGAIANIEATAARPSGDRARPAPHGVGIRGPVPHDRLGSGPGDRGIPGAGGRRHRHVLGTHRRPHPVVRARGRGRADGVDDPEHPAVRRRARLL